MHAERTVVTFRNASFNAKEPREAFINPQNFGDDLAQWLAEGMEKKSIVVERTGEFPGQEDFGWFFNCRVDGDEYCIVVGHHFDAQEFEWVVWTERRCGFLKSMLGGRKKDIDRRIPAVIHDVLSSSSTTTHIRWHKRAEFDRGEFGGATTTP